MKLALAQTCFAPSSMAESLARLDALAAEAQAGGADLLMLPEMFLCGYGRTAPVAELAITVGDETEAALRTLARQRRISLLIGCAERSGDALYNTAMFVPRDGAATACTRKMHLWGDFERETFRPGGRAALVDLAPGLKAGFLICYDLEHAVAAEDLARRGAGVILAISATWAGYEIVPRAIVPARAYENAVFLAFCNSVGCAHGIAYAGLSGVAGPAGDMLAQAPADAEHMLFADIDAARLAPGARPEPQHADRRVDLFPVTPASPA